VRAELIEACVQNEHGVCSFLLRHPSVHTYLFHWHSNAVQPTQCVTNHPAATTGAKNKPILQAIKTRFHKTRHNWILLSLSCGTD